MDINSVPQDDSKTYAKMKKAIYATGEDGKMQTVSSTGWEVEEVATTAALDDIQESIIDAHKQVKLGAKSPLFFHMYEARMDLVVLAQSTGFFQWTIKKDFNPSRFNEMKEERLLEYCDVLGKTIQEIKILPELDYE